MLSSNHYWWVTLDFTLAKSGISFSEYWPQNGYSPLDVGQMCPPPPPVFAKPWTFPPKEIIHPSLELNDFWMVTNLWYYIHTTLEVVLWTVTLLRFLARSLARVFSAMSARWSASSSSCCTLRNLAKLTAAISSYDRNNKAFNNQSWWQQCPTAWVQILCNNDSLHTCHQYPGNLNLIRSGE